jgi:triosephosphate isomerase
MSKKVPLVIGNWKLHPASVKAATNLAADTIKACRGVTDVAVGVAPTFVHVHDVSKRIRKSKVAVAAQSVSVHAAGAHTGEVSIEQLKDLGVTYVIIGHSERRAAGETDAEVQQKIAITLKVGLTPVVCIGEQTRDESGNFYSFVTQQIKSLTSGLTAAQLKKVVIAYEPIWAIGTGETATVEDVKEMQMYIYKVLTKRYDKRTAGSVRLLYGGSVKPHNAAALQAGGGMDGFLVGGASLKGSDFGSIVKACE